MWELDYKEGWWQKNWCFWNVALEKTLESPLDCKEIQPINPKGNQSWVFIGRTDVSWNSGTLATWFKELTHLKRPWCWERLRAGGEGDDRGWDGWMISPNQWTWAWVDSRSWWWTRRPGMLWFMRLQRIRHDWVTELNWPQLQLMYQMWFHCLSKLSYLLVAGMHLLIRHVAFRVLRRQGGVAVNLETNGLWV